LPLLVQCQRVSRFFGEIPVLREVSFNAAGGELLALRGANGAGKTTLLRILAGALRPSLGEVTVGGAPVASVEARRITGFLSHQSLLHPTLTVMENLEFFATLFSLPRPRAAAVQALDQVNGGYLAGRRVGELSQGMKQKAALARCLLHQPRLLLLDEPIASLDRATVAEMRACLARLRDQGLTLILSSHQEEAFAGLTDGELTLERGRLLTPAHADSAAPAGGLRGPQADASTSGTRGSASVSAEHAQEPAPSEAMP
jgi:heme ABC exporter ATP-binding subunit CcmA